MKSRFIVLMLLVFVAALFSGCATTGDLEKLQAQVKQTDMKADQAAAKADMAAKDAAAAKATAAASQADCAKASEACNAAAAKAEQAAARADASAQAGRGQRQEDRSDVHEIHEKVEIRPGAETPEIGNEKAASDFSVTAFLLSSSNLIDSGLTAQSITADSNHSILQSEINGAPEISTSRLAG